MGQQVYVWDKFVRLFHWSLVVLFATSYFSGEEEHWIHVYSGYAITVLVILRVLWGFIGSKYAKFNDFVYSPATVLRYTKSMFGGHPRHYLGHNPAGGVMVLALLATLSVATFSGLKLYAVEEGKGPLAGNVTVTAMNYAYADSDDKARAGHKKKNRKEDEAEEFWEEVHELSVNFLILLVILHVAGVVVASRLHKEALVKAMISGYKEPAGE